MRAMVSKSTGRPLRRETRPLPLAGPGAARSHAGSAAPVRSGAAMRTGSEP